MSRADLVLLLGVFLGGALPWLEAILVVPAGIAAGLHPVAAVAAGVAGNLLTVALAAWSGARVRTWWSARRTRHAAGTDGARTARRRQRIERAITRGGLPALALVGPLGLGTQVSALVASGTGVEARRAFAWIGAGTVLWAVVAAILAVTGLSIAGIGR